MIDCFFLQNKSIYNDDIISQFDNKEKQKHSGRVNYWRVFIINVMRTCNQR
jgi:hypothetical protein